MIDWGVYQVRNQWLRETVLKRCGTGPCGLFIGEGVRRTRV